MAKKKTRVVNKQASETKSGDSNLARNKVQAKEFIRTGFPIVGIGASAGGLEAMEAFFKAMPADAGMGFVLVVHLDPTHISILPELLQKHTKMPVSPVKDGIFIKPNHVYVIPPNKDLTILHGTLHLMELMQPRSANLPIDSFFRSLAQDQEGNAVCVILSGTGTDGTLGVKAIKGATGMVMVQDEASAKYEGMPRSAIATGLADYVLAPAQMPAQLIKYTRHASQKVPIGIISSEGEVPSSLQKIFVILRARTEHDFSLYKKNTICRRIERRMNVHQIDDLGDYVRYLQQSDREVDILFKELLIGVTNFFRDPEAFQVLQTKILPKLLAGKPDDDAVRVWIAGCASGEEAYSVAMVLHECMEQVGRHFHVQIFGTDIDENAIDIARSGLYPASIIGDLGPQRVKRYFNKEEDGQYRVKKLIREMLVFAPQNVIKDPPFTKLDLLCCRNLLIYLGAELQRKLFPIFHYSLKPQGILFLGSSETIGVATDLFSPLHKKWKLFRCKLSPTGAHPVLDFPSQPESYQARDLGLPETVQRAEELSALQLVETILLQSDTPPCAIVNDACNVVYIHGRTGRFLEPAEGKASVNIVEMARPGLGKDLVAAIRQVATHKQEVVIRDIKVQSNGDHLFLTLTARPILEQISMRGLIMVVFEETATPTQEKACSKPTPVKQRRGRSIDELEQELQYNRESLQTTIEELETSNEELKSTNEELQSTNEELQSTNEELETSKEELQSLNEESATVNAELQARIDELSKTNDDMKNLLDSTEIATVFLDTDLRVSRFTARATDLIPLTAADVGRPIQHLASTLIDTDLAEYGCKVLKDLAVREREVKSRDDQCYTMRARPYRTTSNVIDGVVITFDDITELKQAEAMLETQRIFQKAVLDSTANGIVACDQNGVLTFFNRAAGEFHGLPVEPISPEEWSIHYDLYEVDGETPLDLEHIPLVRALKDKTVSNAECVIAPKGRPARTVSVTGQKLVDSHGNDLGAVVSMNDITISRQGQLKSQRNEQLLRAAVDTSPLGLVVAHVDSKARYTWIYNPHSDFDVASLIGKRDDEVQDSPGSRALRRLKEQVIASGTGAETTINFSLSNGDRCYRIAGEPLRDDHGFVVGATTVSMDITDMPKDGGNEP
jgi:two-component system, chemotaxis family, CheB/CheR fusion protein